MNLLVHTALLADTDHWNGHPWWPIFPLVWLLFVGAALACFVIGGRRRRRMAGGHVGEARLAERYAAGEIDEQEYRQRRAVLREQQ